jgi:hypothetical protein
MGSWLMSQESIFVNFGMKLAEGFKTFVVKIFEGVKEIAKDIKEIVDGFNPKNQIVGISLGASSVFPKYANGGFPEDGLFMANHNELVGGFSNGKTAVANNEQITEGIANAVYPAVYNAVMAAMSNGNNSSSPITIEIGGREVFRAVQDEANSYSKRTGRPAFS